MATLDELQKKLEFARFRRTILITLLEYLDANFLPKLGGESVKVLLTEEKVRVPVEAIESASAFLAHHLESISQEIDEALAIDYVVAPKEPPPTQPTPEVQQ